MSTSYAMKLAKDLIREGSPSPIKVTAVYLMLGILTVFTSVALMAAVTLLWSVLYFVFAFAGLAANAGSDTWYYRLPVVLLILITAAFIAATLTVLGVLRARHFKATLSIYTGHEYALRDALKVAPWKLAESLKLWVAILCASVSCRFWYAPTYLVTGKYTKLPTALKQSVSDTSAAQDLSKLHLRLFLWQLLSIVTIGIAGVYVLPLKTFCWLHAYDLVFDLPREQ